MEALVAARRQFFPKIISPKKGEPSGMRARAEGLMGRGGATSDSIPYNLVLSSEFRYDGGISESPQLLLSSDSSWTLNGRH